MSRSSSIFLSRLISLGVLLLMVAGLPTALYAAAQPQLSAYDTIQDFGTVIRIENAPAIEELILLMRGPHGDLSRLTTMSSSSGDARLEVSASALTTVGVYQLRLQGTASSTQFEVYPVLSKQTSRYKGGASLAQASIISLADAIGGDSEPTLLAQASPVGEVSEFQIDNLPASASVNDRLGFRVSALDSHGQVVAGYSGTVIFTSTDVNAELPTPYTFGASDQGRKTFDLGLAFRTVGQQQLIVADQSDTLITGRVNVQVAAPGSELGSGDVRITKPATGTYSVNTLEIAGEAFPNTRVKLYDNGQQIAEIQSNSSGRFTYNTSLLVDGRHAFGAESNGVQSTVVSVTIDSTPAQIESVTIADRAVAPGGVTTITVQSDPDLNAIQATLGDYITDLDPSADNPALYVGQLRAPTVQGDYTVNVILTDSVGNVAPALEVGRVRVDAGLQTGGEFSFVVPSKVTNVRLSSTATGVQLTWDPAQAEAGIDHYRIYFGPNPDELDSVIDTEGTTTVAEITDLQKGAYYSFRLSAVDLNGNESDLLSDTVAARAGEGTGVPVLCDPSPCPPDMPTPNAIPEDGPGVLGMVVASLVGSAGLRRLRKKRT
ncbi:hypothetical protein CO046_01925 [Candidatus Peregrinibacteria bacterium CG_4_9_14_0_2_um_filter_53_11]|nr:MAG: hypothetical protein CO046_01925 [Candidatus Peregrinibacteria bacterium CG_4_9_14_0_2_um_filter_53_11]